METTTFTYTKVRPILGITIFSCFAICFLVLGILIHEIKSWLFLALAIACSIWAVIYTIKYRLIPAIRNYPILEVDAEKLVFYLTDRTIYWKDVVEISWDYYHGKYLSFEMVDGSSNLTIGVSWIAGSNDVIYNTVQEYFGQSLLAK
jgi:hypothetical protein